MRRLMGIPVAAVLLTACVTINVYFPAAEAKEAAKEFVEKVIGDEGKDVNVKPVPDDGGGMAIRSQGPIDHLLAYVDLLSIVGIGTAHAQSQPDITIKTPAIQAIQARMAARFDSQLRAGFDAGALGFAGDGTIVVRDASKLALKDRVAVNQAVADDNRDRKAVYREVAVANGHPEWEAQIRDVFARQWIASARPGWWYQSGGAWKQK
ncbi:YdbL family protein [Lysobacter yangpyeongensis]|uniref:YdbL family protein n=1 Tax=Lysobacter yangpyeongensis TaxID=346182 RepID=A0ABW0SK85_9GAMM